MNSNVTDSFFQPESAQVSDETPHPASAQGDLDNAEDAAPAAPPNVLLEAALGYAAQGFRVIPVRPGAKAARLRDWPNQATTDEGTIRRWWEEQPDANIGLLTEGMVVIDIDGPDNPWPGERSMEPAGGIAITPGGGRHYYYRLPEGREHRNSTGRLADHVDVKTGPRAYVVVPPSQRDDSADGYQWEQQLLAFDQLPLPPCWLIAELDNLANGSVRHVPHRLPPAAEHETILQGVRNDTLTRIAGQFRQQGLSQVELAATLQAVNQRRCVPPLDASEVERIAASVGRYPPACNLDGTRVAPHAIPLTDVGNGQRFVAAYGQDFRYCYPWGKWLAWDGKRWAIDQQGAAEQAAKQVTREMLGEASEIQDDRRRQELARHALDSQQHPRLSAMLKVAQSEPGMPILPNALDGDPWLLNVLNGTLDLRTGELREHRRDDFISKLAPISFDPHAACPRWERFLDEVFAGRTGLIEYCQRFAGMSLTGVTQDHIMGVLYGRGRNGKSTFCETLLALLGPDYGVKGVPNLLMIKHESHLTELADLHGKRLLVCVETAEGRHLNEARIKELTGGDTITARRMREDLWSFRPTHKVLLATNHKPQVKGTDDAIWSRLQMVPFDVSFLGREDRRVRETLMEELPGILAWCVRGCTEWRTHGISMPPEIVTATEKYRRDQDDVGRFLEEVCELGPEGRVQAALLLAAFRAWSGDDRMSQRRLGEKLSERGLEKATRTGRVFWLGVALRPSFPGPPWG